MVVPYPQTYENYEGHLLEERVVTIPTLSKGTWLYAIAMAIAKTVIALAVFIVTVYTMPHSLISRTRKRYRIPISPSQKVVESHPIPYESSEGHLLEERVISTTTLSKGM